MRRPRIVQFVAAIIVTTVSGAGSSLHAAKADLPEWARGGDGTQMQDEGVGGWRFTAMQRTRSKQVAQCADGENQVDGVIAETTTRIRLHDPRGLNRIFTRELARLDAEGRHLIYWTEVDYKHATCGLDAGAEVAVVAASPDLIVVRLEADRFGGGAHGVSNSRNSNWSTRLGRSLQVSDLFIDSRDARLAGLLNANFTGAADGCPGQPLVIDMSRATIRTAGIRFDYDSYELGSYTCSGHSVLTWAELQPFLRTDLPFDPTAMTDASLLRWRLK